MPDTTGRSHLASLIERPPPMQEFRGSRPASEQSRERRYNGAVTRIGVRFREVSVMEASE